MASQITLGTNTYTLIPMPTSPGLSEIEVTMNDDVSVVSSPFVPSQTQTQSWPGADSWSMTITLPKMNRGMSAPWRGFMAELRGMQNVFQIGDPLAKNPLGLAMGTPLCNGTGTQNSTFAQTLYTNGWSPSITNQLIPGDYIQVGLRLYQVCEYCSSDNNGNIAIPIWPSLREAPANGTPIITNNTVGVFRLAQNLRTWHNDYNRLMSVSFKIQEVR